MYKHEVRSDWGLYSAKISSRTWTTREPTELTVIYFMSKTGLTTIYHLKDNQTANCIPTTSIA